jgi:hypothetical protein
MRLFNEDAGKTILERQGVGHDLIAALSLVGISGICNLVAAIKTVRYYEMNGQDVIFLPLTDSMGLYQSRIAELRQHHGNYTDSLAGRHFARYLEGINVDHLRELGYYQRKQLHNFKYFTWVEQQGRSADELRGLWDPDFWAETFGQVGQWDKMISEFNGDSK